MNQSVRLAAVVRIRTLLYLDVGVCLALHGPTEGERLTCVGSAHAQSLQPDRPRARGMGERPASYAHYAMVQLRVTQIEEHPGGERG